MISVGIEDLLVGRNRGFRNYAGFRENLQDTGKI